jgi:hypothetical protein
VKSHRLLLFESLKSTYGHTLICVLKPEQYCTSETFSFKFYSVPVASSMRNWAMLMSESEGLCLLGFATSFT